MSDPTGPPTALPPANRQRGGDREPGDSLSRWSRVASHVKGSSPFVWPIALALAFFQGGNCYGTRSEREEANKALTRAEQSCRDQTSKLEGERDHLVADLKLQLAVAKTEVRSTESEARLADSEIRQKAEKQMSKTEQLCRDDVSKLERERDHIVEDLKLQLADTKADVRSAQGETRSALGEISSLRAANQQKVCLDAQWTAHQRSIAVRRLRVAVVDVLKELRSHPLEPKADAVPLFQLRFLGLEGFDPTLFEEDDDTVQTTHSLAGLISMLNVELDRMRSWDYLVVPGLPASSKEEGFSKTKQLYEQHRLAGIAGAETLIRHLDDRYKSAEQTPAGRGLGGGGD
jgi:hypothetical protein